MKPPDRYVEIRGRVLHLFGDQQVLSDPSEVWSRGPLRPWSEVPIRRKQEIRGKRMYNRLLRTGNALDFRGSSCFDLTTFCYGRIAPDTLLVNKHINLLLLALRNRKLLRHYFGVIEFSSSGPHFHLLSWDGTSCVLPQQNLARMLRRLWRAIVGRFASDATAPLVNVRRDTKPRRFQNYVLKRAQKPYSEPGKRCWASRNCMAPARKIALRDELAEIRLRWLISTHLWGLAKTKRSAWLVAALHRPFAYLSPAAMKSYINAANRPGPGRDYIFAGRSISEMKDDLKQIRCRREPRW